MTQCAGKTQKGERCKREVRDGSSFCAIHQEQESRARAEPRAEWDADGMWKAALGCALIVAILLFRIRR